MHGVDTGRRKENKDNFALFSVASSKTSGSNAKIESNTGKKRGKELERVKKRFGFHLSQPIVALFWGRGRQKWRRPPVRPLPSYARFSSFRRRLNPKIPRGKRGNRRRIDGEEPPQLSYPYPMIVTQHPRGWSAKNAWNCQPSAAISVKLRDQRINFPSSVPRTRKWSLILSLFVRSWIELDERILIYWYIDIAVPVKLSRYSVELYWMCSY